MVLLFPAANADHFPQFAHEDNPIAFVSGVGGLANRFGNARGEVVGTDHFKDDLAMVVNVVLGQFELTARAAPATLTARIAEG